MCLLSFSKTERFCTKTPEIGGWSIRINVRLSSPPLGPLEILALQRGNTGADLPSGARLMFAAAVVVVVNV